MCGETRISIMALVTLPEAFCGPRRATKEASPHKAAMLLHGKTMHAAGKLHGWSSARAAHLRMGEARARELDIRHANLVAKAIGELSQTSAQLSHTDAYITTIAKPRHASWLQSVMLNRWKHGVVFRWHVLVVASSNSVVRKLMPSAHH